MAFLKLRNKVKTWSISLILVFLSIFLISNVSKNISLYNKQEAVIEWDAISLYAYLPAFFIYNDIKLDFVQPNGKTGDCSYTIWYSENNKGQRIIKTSMGVSYMYLPFFLGAHWYSSITNNPTCGYSPIYKIGIIISCLFYLFLGLFFLRKILLKYYSELVTSIVLIILLAGTSLSYYSIFLPAYTHIFSFALVTMFLYFSIKWNEAPRFTYSIALGLLIGVITLIRPTNFLIVLVWILYNIYNLNSLKLRIKFFFTHYSKILLIAFLAFLTWIPQLIYWKYVTGDFFYYSYGENERFFFNHPHIIEGLFGFRKGFFIYTPIMIFAFIGLYYYFKQNKALAIPIIIYSLLTIYVTLSWWCWWYGGCLGMRPFIDSYAIWCLPLAALINQLNSQKIGWIIGIYLSMSIFIWFNFMYMKKYRTGGVHFDSMTWKAYKTSIFMNNTGNEYWNALCIPDYEEAQKGIDSCSPIK